MSEIAVGRRATTPDQTCRVLGGASLRSGVFRDRELIGDSGTKSQRPGLDQALDTLRDVDALVVWKLDRLGQSLKDFLAFAGNLNNRGLGLVGPTDAIDTSTVPGRCFFNVMADAKIRSARKLLNRGIPPSEFADTLGVSVPTLYRWVPAAGIAEAL